MSSLMLRGKEEPLSVGKIGERKVVSRVMCSLTLTVEGDDRPRMVPSAQKVGKVRS